MIGLEDVLVSFVWIISSSEVWNSVARAIDCL